MKTLPIPQHLDGLLEINEKKSKEKILYATLVCCGKNNMRIETSINDYVCIVKAICCDCGKEIIVFDNRKHGWDGYVCKLFNEKEESPFEKYNCRKCKSETFKVNICIRSQGIEDFIEEACTEVDPETNLIFTKEEWVNAFSWITIELECTKCGKKQNLIDFETM